MADDEDFEIWDDDFLEKVIEKTEAAVCSSASNPTSTLFHPPLISYSPPRELSQIVNENSSASVQCPKQQQQEINRFKIANESISAFDCPVFCPKQQQQQQQLEIDRLKIVNENSSVSVRCPKQHQQQEINRLKIVNENSSASVHCPKQQQQQQQEIDRLKKELGKVLKLLTSLEQECVELRKDKEKQHLTNAQPFSTNKKNKEPIKDPSLIRQGTKGAISCKAVGVQTDDQAILTDLTIYEKFSVSRKLSDIWDLGCDQQPRTNLISMLFVACEADLQFLFGSLGLNIPSKKTSTKMDIDPKHCIQAVEAEKVSHLYITLTKTSYDIKRLDDLLEALVDLCCLENTMIIHRSLSVLHVVLKHILSMENRSYCRDNVIVNDPSTSYRSFEKHSELGHLLWENSNETSNRHHQVPKKLKRAKKIWNKDSLSDDSQPLISCSKWFSLFKMMHQVVIRHSEDSIRVELVSIMNILLLRTDAYAEREMYGDMSIFQCISELLRKEVGVGVQKQTVHLLYLLLNCPNLMSRFCSCKEEGTTEGPTPNAKTAAAFQGAVLDGVANCLSCRGNGAPVTLVLKLKRNAIILLAFLASSGRSGFEILLGRNRPRRTNFLYLILQILASEIDVEVFECIQPTDDFKERTLLIREALILLNRLVSSSQYSTPVLHALTSRRDMAILAVDIASRLSRKNKWSHQSDTMTRHMRESEIMDLARIFKKRVFTFLGDAAASDK